MELRKAMVSDLLQLVEIRMAYISADIGEISAELDVKIRNQLRLYFAENLGKTVFSYIAEDSGKLVSSVFLVVSVRLAFPTIPTGSFGTLLNVYTASEYRHRGIAGALVKMALDDGKSLNLSHIELLATNEGKSLYKKLGFEPSTTNYTPMKYNY